METSNRHLGRETLRRLAAGLSSANEAQLDHLVSCESCAGDLMELLPEDPSVRICELLDEPDGPPPVTDLPEAHRQLLGAFRRRREELLEAAPAAFKRLLEMNQQERLAAVHEEPSLATLPVGEALLEEIPRWWHRDPHHAGDLAKVAVAILTPLNSTGHFLVPPSRALEALAHAWALYGNALRVQGDLPQAEKHLLYASELAEESKALGVRARAAEMLAELLRDQRRFAEAADACREAEELYIELGDRPMQARTRVLEASIWGESGDHDGAVAVLRDLLQSYARDEMEEVTYLAATQSYCHRLVQAGRPREALARLNNDDALTAARNEPLARCRVRWVRALALMELGERNEGEALLRQVLKTFAEHELPYDAALAGLDLAKCFLRARKLGRAAELAQELTPIFLSRGVHREATAAGLVATHALECETATVNLLRDVARFLHQVRRDPSLRYAPPGD